MNCIYQVLCVGLCVCITVQKMQHEAMGERGKSYENRERREDVVHTLEVGQTWKKTKSRKEGHIKERTHI